MAVEPYMEITEQLTELPAWDFSIAGFRGDDLIIAGGTDGPISPERATVTLHFINVAYTSVLWNSVMPGSVWRQRRNDHI